MVELAFLTPFLLLLLIGCIEIGRYAYFSIAVGNAAHAGAAYASQSTSTAAQTANITAAVCYDFNGTSGTGTQCGLTVTTTYTCQCDSQGTMSADSSCAACGATQALIPYVQVKATGTFTPIFNYPGIPKSFTVTRTATMRINY